MDKLFGFEEGAQSLNAELGKCEDFKDFIISTTYLQKYIWLFEHGYIVRFRIIT